MAEDYTWLQPLRPETEEEAPPEASSLFRRGVVDPLVGLAKGTIVGIPETVIGLANIPTLGYAGKAVEAGMRGVGLRTLPEMEEAMTGLLTPETRQAQKEVQETKGFFPTVGAALQRPSTIAQVVAESIPSMAVGARVAGAALGVGAQGISKAERLRRGIMAGGIGEGAITAGQNIESIRQQTEEGVLTPEQVAIGAVSGALTGAIGMASGKFAKWLKLEDFDTLLTGARSGVVGGDAKNVFKKIIVNAFREGVIEELPQSLQEQIAENIALGKPIDDNVMEQGAMGMLAGFAQGAGAQIAGDLLDRVKRKDPVDEAIDKMIAETDPEMAAMVNPPVIPETPKAPAAPAPEAVPPAAPIQEAPVALVAPEAPAKTPVETVPVTQEAEAPAPEAITPVEQPAEGQVSPPAEVPPVEDQVTRDAAATHPAEYTKGREDIAKVIASSGVETAAAQIDAYKKGVQNWIAQNGEPNEKVKGTIAMIKGMEDALVSPATIAEQPAGETLAPKTATAPSETPIAPGAEIAPQEAVSKEIPPQEARTPAETAVGMAPEEKAVPEAKTALEQAVPEIPALLQKSDEHYARAKALMNSTDPKDQALAQQELAAGAKTFAQWRKENPNTPDPREGQGTQMVREKISQAKTLKATLKANQEGVDKQLKEKVITPEVHDAVSKINKKLERLKLNVPVRYAKAATRTDEGDSIVIDANTKEGAQVLRKQGWSEDRINKAKEVGYVARISAETVRHEDSPGGPVRQEVILYDQSESVDARHEAIHVLVGAGILDPGPAPRGVTERAHEERFVDQVLKDIESGKVDFETLGEAQAQAKPKTSTKAKESLKRIRLEAKRSLEVEANITTVSSEEKIAKRLAAGDRYLAAIDRKILDLNNRGSELLATDQEGAQKLFSQAIRLQKQVLGDQFSQIEGLTDLVFKEGHGRYEGGGEATLVIQAKVPEEKTGLFKAILAREGITHDQNAVYVSYNIDVTEPEGWDQSQYPSTIFYFEKRLTPRESELIIQLMTESGIGGSTYLPADMTLTLKHIKEYDPEAVEWEKKIDSFIDKMKASGIQHRHSRIWQKIDDIRRDDYEGLVRKHAAEIAHTIARGRIRQEARGYPDVPGGEGRPLQEAGDYYGRGGGYIREAASTGPGPGRSVGKPSGLSEKDIREGRYSVQISKQEALKKKIILKKDPSAGSPVDFKNKDVILTHWSKEPNLTKTDPEKHGTGYSGAERKSKDAYPNLWIQKTYAGYGTYEAEEGLGPHRYQIDIKGNDLYDIWEDPLKLDPSADEVRKMGYYTAAAQHLIHEQRIRQLGFKGFVSTPHNVAAIYEPVSVQKVEPATETLPQKESRYSVSPEQGKGTVGDKQAEYAEKFKGDYQFDPETQVLIGSRYPTVVPRYFYHRPPSELKEGIKAYKNRNADGSSEYIDKAFGAPASDNIVWLSRQPDYGKTSSLRIDLAQLDPANLRDTGQAEGNIWHRGDIPESAIVRQSPEQGKGDAAYLKAVKSGDMETAQKMVDEAAREAGYKIGPVYHGAGEKFNQFDTRGGGWFISSKKEAAEYGNGEDIVSAYLSMKNPLTMTHKENATYGAELAERKARRLGNDGVIIPANKEFAEENVYTEAEHDVYVALSPEQIKSADPVTYDDQGNVIPLSERFNEKSPDVRYSIKTTLSNAIAYMTGKSQTPVSSTTQSASWDTPQKTKMSDMVYSIFDKQIDMREVVKNIKAYLGSIKEDIDPSQKETLFHGRVATKSEDFIRDEFHPLIEDMAAKKVDLEEFETYLWNRHAEEANNYVASINQNMPDKGSGIATQDARDYLAALDPKKRMVYAALAKRVDAILEKNAQILLDEGLESKSTIDRWKKAYRHYVPLFREDLEGRLGTGTGFSVTGASSKGRHGSTRPVANILANIAEQRDRYIVRSEKNRIAKALYGLAKLNPNEEFWRLARPTIETHTDIDTGLTVKIAGLGYKQRDNVVMHREIDPKTKEVVEKGVEFNDRNERALRMAHAIRNIDMDRLGEILGISAKITRYISSINTQYNPVFGVVNFIRDVGTAMLNLSTTPISGKQKEVAQNSLPALRAIFSSLRGGTTKSAWGDLWREFQERGGRTGYRDLFRTPTARTEEIEKEIKGLTRGQAMKKGRVLFDLLSHYNTAMENAVRLSAYKAGIDSGMTKDAAAVMAKELTVNFNRKGQIATQAGAMYAFFNASAQGISRMYQTLAGPAGKKIIYGGITVGVLQAALLAAAGFDDDEPPQFVRERNLVIPTGGKSYITIPFPLGFHFLPNFGRIVSEWALSGFDKPLDRLGDYAGVLAEAFNPLGSSGVSLQTITPTPIDPLVALAENKDWTGKPIARQDYSQLSPTPGFTRAKDSATVFGKAFSWALNMLSGGTKYKPGLFSPTPDQIDYLGGQLLGGVGRELGKAEQFITGAVTGEEVPTYKIPLAGRFFGTTEGSTQERSRFFTNIKEMNKHENEIKGRMKSGQPISGYFKDNPEARIWRAANAVENSISRLNQQKRALKERGASKVSMETLDKLIYSKMKNFNERYEALR